MRQYRIAPWIVLILSIINFTIAVPVAVRGTHGVRVYMEDVANDKIAALQKRMADNNDDDDDNDNNNEDDNEDDNGDDGDESESDVTSEYERPYHGGPDSETGSNTDPNAGSDTDDGDDDDGGDEDDGGGGEEDDNDDNQEDEDQEDEDPESDVDDDDGDADDEADDHESPPNSPESEHPTGYTYESKGLSGWGKLLKDVLRPRTSTSGAVDAPKRELRETDDTRAPGHSQTRKKWMLDRLD